MRIYSNVLLLSDLDNRAPAFVIPPGGAWTDLPEDPLVRGRYLARLYDIDPDMRVGLWYRDRADFHAKTKGKYRRRTG